MELGPWCMTVTDPATGWFKIAKVPNVRADFMANFLETTWLSQHPWPTETRMDKGRESAGEVAAALKEQCGICHKVITTRNPQANSMVERIHQVIGDMMRTGNIRGSEDPDKDFGWSGVLAAVRHAVNSTVHTRPIVQR